MNERVSSTEVREQMERIYRDRPLDTIPWNHERPPAILVDLVESGRIPRCRAVDLGCGAGNYAVWLATRGYEVTGIDLSPAALEHARRLAGAAGVSCDFVAADLVAQTAPFAAVFDFGYDWEVLHHIFPGDRERYVANVRRMLRPGARYLSVCFSERDTSFGGQGKCRRTPIGTTLYFSSEGELTQLFQRGFRIDELSTIEVQGKGQPHLVVKALMTRTRALKGSGTRER